MPNLKTIFFLSLTVLAIQAGAQTDDKEEAESKNDVSQILDSMGYPELQVVPRASERLRMEAKSESGSWFVSHWPVELSGLYTLYVGLTANSNRRSDLESNEETDAKTIATITTGVGAAWVVGGVLLGAQRPYRSGLRSVNKINGKDERSQLMRERLAEEALEKPARTMRVLQYISVATNLTVNALSTTYANDQGKITAGLGVILSFLPLVFKDPTITVYEKHIEYKKKIYAPLATGSLHIDSTNGVITPVTNLVWLF